MFAKKKQTTSTAKDPLDENSSTREHLHHHHLHTPEDEQLISSGRGSSLAGSQLGSFSAPRSTLDSSLQESASSEQRLNDEKQHFLLADSAKGVFLKQQQQQHSQQGEEEEASNREKKKKKKRLSYDDSSSKKAPKAKLAKQESIDEKPELSTSCRRMRMLILVLIICCVAAIYCIPYVEIEPRIPKLLPHIPFNFREAPLRPSSSSQFKFEHLFYGQFHGAESVAIDSSGNMYLAVEGGFILYAHLNASSPIKHQYYDNSLLQLQPPSDSYAISPPLPDYLADVQNRLVKIAELNAIKQLPYEGGTARRRARDGAPEATWRRECQLDEQVYGPTLSSGGPSSLISAQLLNDVDSDAAQKSKRFESKVAVSRCSKPLGIRLSRDESYLYVVDTLSGLFRVNLKVSDRPNSSQRRVTKLIDFRANKSRQLLPVAQLDQLSAATASAAASQQPAQVTGAASLNNAVDQPSATNVRTTTQLTYLNVSLLAVDDLVIDYGAGTRGSDIIYLSVGSQSWMAVSFVYDMLEGRPTGVVLRYDTGANQLSVLNPSQIAHVRSSIINERPSSTNASSYSTTFNITANNNELPYLGMGAPRLDENDVFDDRPLHFPNGLELTDDRQAILIADTVNKRILKHYVNGPRRGTTDLWTWTPNYPDNIRRGFDRRQETYWVVGCGHDNTNQPDYYAWLASWPRLRKYILKNIYLFGWLVESFGGSVLRSTSVRDFGYSIKIGHSICENMCSGMMILQYNKYGDVVRSIYSKEFPSDMIYYSQVNEVIDAQSQEHILYLSSPAYQYVTKLTLPTDSFDSPPRLANEIR